MKATTVVGERYALSLFAVAKHKKRIESLLTELIDVSKLLDESLALHQALNDPRYTPKEKKAILKRVFSELSPLGTRFLDALVEHQRVAYLQDVIVAYKDLVEKYQGIIEVDVTTVSVLPADTVSRIQAKLEKDTGRNVVLHLHENSSLIGGIMIRMGDRLIDQSLAGHLARLKSRLLDGQAEVVGGQG